MKKIYQDKGIRMLKNRQSRERANKILPLLQECKTDREVSERLGYVSPDSVYCYIHQYKLREKTTVTPAPKRGRLPFPPKPPKPPTPAQPPVCHSPEKTVSSAQRISLRQRARRIIPLYKQGETVEGIAARLDLSVKNVFYWLQFHGFIYAESGNPTDYILPLYEFGFSPEEIQDLFGYMKLETILSRLRQEK